MMGIMAQERGGKVFATDERSVSAYVVDGRTTAEADKRHACLDIALTME